MFEINRQKFGAFVADLRKEKGYTQKELAAKLYISDKAISKWETGVSIPDITLLIPLSEALGVTVTELLKYQRIEKAVPMDAMQVEDIVKKAISYSEETAESNQRFHKKGFMIYLLCLAVCTAEMAVMFHLGYTSFSLNEYIMTVVVLCSVFGLYFTAFVIKKLPAYYDDNRISAFSDGPMRMNLPGVHISNRNWPYIVKVGQIWSMGTLTVYPLLSIIMETCFAGFWAAYEQLILLAIVLGGLFVPLVIVGKKYQ